MTMGSPVGAGLDVATVVSGEFVVVGPLEAADVDADGAAVVATVVAAVGAGCVVAEPLLELSSLPHALSAIAPTTPSATSHRVLGLIYPPRLIDGSSVKAGW
jgi:hypothetical protein